ncbi:hypothetical protein [Evansella cellulosilytica]|uniref:BCCT transporter n=1 Tax=Evansella cellulosilytica (strain ATCC 21833 / DSM 2522 / FERM P-1141 / JCM 9156 / N-4) TaxID=649639 RepID=E6TSL3_EVAC2|nr:hypothetical protein [Evansella cellulosilytica]ADU29521.1 BCCT transporter [Evansella cellulosilytica DSM 2522]
MKNKLLLIILLSCILGSALISSLAWLTYTFKATFYGIALAVLVITGFVYFSEYFRRGKERNI